jgi:glutamate-ammonia-ligase adenylyltransferase
VDGRFVQSFLERMDDDYFDSFSAEDIASHIRLSSGTSRSQRVLSQIAATANEEFFITIVGFDYPSQFAVLCGLLSAFGLDIRSGDIYSSKAIAGSARIVDVFRVWSPHGSFDAKRQTEFGRELETLTNLLAEQSLSEARAHLNRALTERIEQMAAQTGAPFAPIELDFSDATEEDDASKREWTVMEVRCEDAFGILYAIAYALSVRSVYVHKVKIRSEAGRTRDRFYIADAWGRAIDAPNARQRLHWTINMIARFTRFLTEAPDPATAMRHFDQLLDRLAEGAEFPDREVSLLATHEGMNLLAHLLGSSDYLWTAFLGAHSREFLPYLESLASGTSSTAAIFPSRAALEANLSTLLAAPSPGTLDLAANKRLVNDFKNRQLFLIETQHAVDPEATSIEFSRALTDLAEVVLNRAAAACYAHLADKRGAPSVGAFAIFALGKFGGCEMGHASDLELLFVHDSPQDEFYEALARSTVDFIEAQDKNVFHIDLRLRPYGDAGPRSSPFSQFSKYYSAEGAAAPFERQALIKLRWFGGDEALGRRVEDHRDSYTYSGAPWDWKDAMELRHRQMAELVRPGQINVKYSAGGLIDIEYAVQYLQILNGSQHPETRTPTTLHALEGLRRFQIVREPDYWLLRASYLFLRKLIDALRIVRGDASDLVLPEPDAEEFKSLARRLGYHGKERSHDAAVLAAQIDDTMQKVHEYFLNRFDSAPR